VRHRGALLPEPPGNLVAPLDRAITRPDPPLGSEHVRHFGPQAELRVLRISTLEILHRAQRFQPTYVASQLVDVLRGRRLRVHCGGRHQQQQGYRGETGGDPGHNNHSPALLRPSLWRIAVRDKGKRLESLVSANDCATSVNPDPARRGLQRAPVDARPKMRAALSCRKARASAPVMKSVAAFAMATFSS